jgi:hypothetical protein
MDKFVEDYGMAILQALVGMAFAGLFGLVLYYVTSF